MRNKKKKVIGRLVLLLLVLVFMIVWRKHIASPGVEPVDYSHFYDHKYSNEDE
jgi:hypothetical protein